MKVSYVVVVGAVLGAALGAGISWARFGNTPTRLSRVSVESPDAPPGDRPKLRVDEKSHDFGKVERDVEARHVFHFKNIGQRTLTLKASGTSCSKCTIAELDKPEVAPGESAEVAVVYVPGDVPSFRQMAWITTNDPDQPRVELSIVGTVTTRYEVVPPHLVLSKVSATETKRAEVKIYAFFSDEVAVVGHEFTDAESAPYFEVKSEPIPADQAAERKAKSGCRVEVALKPGLPLGPFRQTIRLQLRMSGTADNPTVELPIMGTIDSDISIVGPDWNADAGRLSIGTVNAGEGATRRVLLLVRGEHRHDVTVKPAKVDPAWLKVAVGEPSDLPSGAVTQIPLTIEIPPNMPQVNHLGTDQGKYAEIILETTHSQLKQIRMYLRFVIVP
jgi:hypothetical protein